jgi:predicted DNA-binding protein (UPF0251 family)
VGDQGNETIKALAEKCARGGLSIKASVDLFEALYIADALVLSGGIIAKAAAKAGISRSAVFRIQSGGKRGRPKVEKIVVNEVDINGEIVFGMTWGKKVAHWPVAPILMYGGVTFQPNQPRATFPTRDLADLAVKAPGCFVWLE